MRKPKETSRIFTQTQVKRLRADDLSDFLVPMVPQPTSGQEAIPGTEQFGIELVGWPGPRRVFLQEDLHPSKYQVGDAIRVRENWRCDHEHVGDYDFYDTRKPWPPFDGCLECELEWKAKTVYQADSDPCVKATWKSAATMPYWATRMHLVITKVCAIRLVGVWGFQYHFYVI